MLQIILKTSWCWDPYDGFIPALQWAGYKGNLCQELSDLPSGLAGQLGGTKLHGVNEGDEEGWL